ncbi:LamG domain-containing protein [Streptomyces abyssomicinicus]|uniref:LamG domain-containing protein n=1 Tax=Streptomyces abyssomicinicus TaxID=574929 RepID=UPI00124FC3B8|nr:LamG domain-containing protein [Streptomyces abyssomicinicus]
MDGNGRRRRGVVAWTAAALLAVTPGVAAAAENTPPERPGAADLLTGSAPCAAGEDAPYVRMRPGLQLTLRDPDPYDSVSAEIEVWWTGEDGTGERHTLTTTATATGSPLTLAPSFTYPSATRVSWRARATDQYGATSPWSDENGGHACEFVTDFAEPEPATVASDEYPAVDPSDPQDGWHGGAGLYGGFTFGSPSEDVVRYAYSFTGGPQRWAEPEEPGGPVAVRYMPEKGGVFTLTVQAFDRAGNGSRPTHHQFRVASGRAPVAHWTLAGSPAAQAGPELRAEDGVTFRPQAPAGTGLTGSARLSGSGNGYLTPDGPVVDTENTFAVSLWARPEASGRAMTLASQDTSDGASAFTLGLRPAAAGGDGVWSFTFGGATVTGGRARSGEWSHVLGLFDTEDDTLRLYVDGEEVGEEGRAVPVAAPGAFQLGRSRGNGGQRWQGDLADVRVWDRVVAPPEIAELARQDARITGAWQFESVEDGVSPAVRGEVPFALGGGAEIREDAAWGSPYGQNLLALDGVDGYATTAAPVVGTGDSFTVAALVDLTDWSALERPMTAFTVGGEEGETLSVRLEPATATWQLVRAGADGVREVLTEQYASSYYANELVLIHDARADRIRLYVDGQAGEPAELAPPRAVEGTLHLGRGRTAGGWGDQLAGTVDEVRVWHGVLPDEKIRSYHWTAP